MLNGIQIDNRNSVSGVAASASPVLVPGRVLVPLDPLPSNLRFTALATVPHCGDPTLTLTTLWVGGVRILHAAPTSCRVSFLSSTLDVSTLTSESRGVLNANKQGSVVGGMFPRLVDVAAGAPLPSYPVKVTCHRSHWPWRHSRVVRFLSFGVLPTLAMLSQRRDAAISLLTCSLAG